MSDKLKKTLLGALVTVGLALAVSYGLISQQTADTVQTRADQVLSDDRPTADAPSQAPAPDNSEARPRPEGNPAPGEPTPRP